MSLTRAALCAAMIAAVATNLSVAAEGQVSGELRKWHKVTITFEGPDASERDPANPFAKPFTSFRQWNVE